MIYVKVLCSLSQKLYADNNVQYTVTNNEVPGAGDFTSF